MSSLRDGSIGARVQRLEREAINLKTAQFTGSDSIKTYCIQTTNDYDWSYTTGTATDAINIYFKFSADHQDAPLAQPTMDILIDNNAHYRVGIADSTGGKTDNGLSSNGWVDDFYGAYSPTHQPNKRNELSWYNSIVFMKSGTNIKIKFRAWATDTGKITVGYDSISGGVRTSGLIIQ